MLRMTFYNFNKSQKTIGTITVSGLSFYADNTAKSGAAVSLYINQDASGAELANTSADSTAHTLGVAPASFTVAQYTAPVDPADTPVGQFVTRLYQDVLGRAPDTGGFNYWYNGLVNNNLTGAQATTNFFFSSEFINKSVDDATFLTILYNTCMNRAPDAAGLAYWKGIMAKGWSRKYILNQFMISGEFKNICASYGITAGSITLRNSELKPGVTAFVSRLFTTFMNRAADAAGLDYWTGQMIIQGISPKTIAGDFVNSTEFQSKNLDNTQYVTSLYNGLLGRAPDTAGLNYWVGQISANPAARKTLLSQFVNSAEFAGICASFGL